MFKRIVGARNVSLDDIPVYMEDFDDLEEYYFSRKRDPNVMKDARLRGLYEYVTLAKPPAAKRVHVPYRLLAQLASVAPEGALEKFVVKRLIDYGMVKEGSPELSLRIQWASAWALREGRAPSAEVMVPAHAEKAIRQFSEKILICKDADQVQGAAFDAIRANGLTPADFFPLVYSVLLGSDRGPRLGPYVMDAGAKKVSERLLSALGSTHN